MVPRSIYASPSAAPRVYLCRRTTMNLFTIIGVIVVAVFILGYFGLR